MKLEDEDFARKLKVYDFTTQLYTTFCRINAAHADVVRHYIYNYRAQLTYFREPSGA